MPDFKKSYKVGTDTYHIPEAEADSFLKDFPDAKEVKSFAVGKDKFNIPESEVDMFKMDMPDAKPTQDYNFVTPKNEPDTITAPGFNPSDTTRTKLENTGPAKYPMAPEEIGADGLTKPLMNAHKEAYDIITTPEKAGQWMKDLWGTAKQSSLGAWNSIKRAGYEVGKLAGEPIIGDYSPEEKVKRDEHLKNNLEELNKQKAAIEEYTPVYKSAGYIGGSVPYIAMATASLATGSGEIALGSKLAFAALGIGEGANAYDNHVKETREPENKSTKALTELLYGALYTVPIAEKLGRYMPKQLIGKILGKEVLNPEILGTSGKIAFETFAKEQPTLAKQYLSTALKGIPGSVAGMETMMLGTKAVDEKVIGNDVSWSEYGQTAVEAALTGIAFHVAVTPFAVGRMRADTQSRWDKQGSVSITLDEKGRSVEVLPSQDGKPQKGMRPDGTIVDVTPDMAKNAFIVPTEVLKSEFNTVKQTGQASLTIERDAFSGRVTDMTNRLSDKDGNIYAGKDANGNNLYLVGKDANGNNIAVDSAGQQVSTDPSIQWNKVNKGDVWQSLMNNYDQKNAPRQAPAPGLGGQPTGQAQPTQPADPRTQTAQQAASFHQQHADKTTGLLRQVQEITPGQDPNKVWFVTKEVNGGEGNHFFFVEDGEGTFRQLSASQVAEPKEGEPNNISQQDYVDTMLSQFDMNEQAKTLSADNTMEFDNEGKKVILERQKATNEDGETFDSWIDENGMPVEVPEEVTAAWDKAREVKPELPANIVKRTFGKTSVTGTKDEQGNIAVSDPMTVDEANNLKEEVEKNTGGKATIKAEPIPNEDTTLPVNYQVSIVPNVQEEIATTGQAPTERKIVPQKFGNTELDIVENEGFDEVVASDKMPLEKALPVLEKKFKNHPKFKLEVEKAQVEIPAETKYDDPTFKTVIKSIKIVPISKAPEIKNNSNQNSEKVPNNSEQTINTENVANVNKPEGSQILQENEKQKENTQPKSEGSVSNVSVGNVGNSESANGKTDLSGNSNELKQPVSLAPSDTQSPDKGTATAPEVKKPLSKIQKEAYDLETSPTDVRAIVLKHFIAGGRINKSALQELFGNAENNSKDKAVEAERRSRFTWTATDGQSISEIAHSLWEDHGMDNPGMTDQDFREVVEDVIKSYTSPVQMANDLIKSHREKGAQFSDAQIEEMEVDNGLQNEEVQANEQIIADEIDNNPEIINILGEDFTDNISFYGNDKGQGSENNQENLFEGQENTPASNGGIDGKNKEGKEVKEPSVYQKQIDDLTAERTKIIAEKRRKEATLNERNGLFGDVKQAPNDMFAGEGFDASQIPQALKKYDDQITAIDTQIEKLKKLDQTAIEADKAQVKLVIPEESLKSFSDPKRYNSTINVGEKYYDNRYGDSYTIESITPFGEMDAEVVAKYNKGTTRTEKASFILYHIDAKQHSLVVKPLGEVLAETRKEKEAEKETDKAINEVVAEYGWSAIKNKNGDHWLVNSKGTTVAIVKTKKDGSYTISDMGTQKLMSGKGQIGVTVEKLLKDYYFAQKKAALPVDSNDKIKEPVKTLEEVVKEGKEKVEEKKNEPIVDYGEKVGGAKKDIIRKYFNKINLNGTTLSTIFPKPDIKGLLETGLSVKDVSAIKVAYEFAIAEKKRGADRIKFCAAYAKNILAESINLEFTNNNYVFTDHGKALLAIRTEAFVKVSDKLGNEYLNLDLTKFQIKELTENDIKAYVKKPEGKFEVRYYVNPRMYFDTLDDAMNEFADQVKKNTTTDKIEYKRKISVYYSRYDKEKANFLAFKPSGKDLIVLKDGFKHTNEAFQYLKDNEADLHTMLERILA